MRGILCGLVEEIVPVGEMVFPRGCLRGEGRLDSFRMVHRQGTIDLIGGNVVETLPLVFLRKALPVELCGLEE